MAILTAVDLDGTGDLTSAQNISAILFATHPLTKLCVCDAEAMTLICGGARANKTLAVNGVFVSFMSWQDATP